MASLLKANRRFARYLLDRIESFYDQNCIVEFVMQNNKNDTKNNTYIKHVIDDIMVYNIRVFLSMFIDTAYLGGLGRSSIFTRMLEAFETGGIPCGWLGPLLPEDGGDPVRAIALLHFGKLAEE